MKRIASYTLTRSGWCAVVVAEVDDVGAVRFAARRGWPVGENVPLPQPKTLKKFGEVRTQTMTRELTQDAAHELAHEILEFVVGHGAEKLLIERPHGSGNVARRARMMVEAIGATMKHAGLVAEVVDGVGRYDRNVDAGRLARDIAGWAAEEELPEGQRPRETERRAATLLLPREERSGDGVPAQIRGEDRGDPRQDGAQQALPITDRLGTSEAQHDRQRQRLDEPQREDASGDAGGLDAGHRSLGDTGTGGAREVAPSPPKLHTRTAGIDAGTTHVAATVTEGDIPPLAYIASDEFTYGRETRNKRGEKGRTFSDADTLAMADQIDAFLKLHQVDRVIVEQSTNIIPYKDENKAILVARTVDGANQALKTNHIAGLILGILIGRGYEAFPSVTAIAARGRVAPKKRSDTRTKDERIEAAVRGHIPSWPAHRMSNNHERDAGMLCIYAGLLWRDAVSEEGAREEPKRRAPRVPRERPQSATKAKRSAVRAERDAAGCTCRSPKHKRSCPAFVPQAAARDIVDMLKFRGPQPRADLCDYGSAESDLRERALDMLVEQGDVELDGELYRIVVKPRATPESDGAADPQSVPRGGVHGVGGA